MPRLATLRYVTYEGGEFVITQRLDPPYITAVVRVPADLKEDVDRWTEYGIPICGEDSLMRWVMPEDLGFVCSLRDYLVRQFPSIPVEFSEDPPGKDVG